MLRSLVGSEMCIRDSCYTTTRQRHSFNSQHNRIRSCIHLRCTRGRVPTQLHTILYHYHRSITSNNDNLCSEAPTPWWRSIDNNNNICCCSISSHCFKRLSNRHPLSTTHLSSFI
eukprot:TRINITY_DN14217_c0_g1_i2.p1 TRINITY_DN14217_c0_g1~~TRINITY_DN14217_c0_g1_i2.p1  ORF type:complete len:115 (+),score=17.34 TRINITY_DN14217_c0_g1_i2:82-426(+)